MHLPKQSTLEIQNKIKALGEQLGFISVIEERIHERETYAPIYDAVWYMDLTEYFDLDSLKPLFKHNPKLLDRIKNCLLQDLKLKEQVPQVKIKSVILPI